MTPREREVLGVLAERPRDVRAVTLAVLGRHDRDAVANMRTVLRRLAAAGLAARRAGTGPAIWESREEPQP